MSVNTVCCNGCGAPLKLPDGANYVTCQFCNASLHVQRNDSVVFTELVDSLKKTTDDIANSTSVLALQNQLILLQQEWDRKSSSLMIRGKDGHAVEPNALGLSIGAFIGIPFILLWICVAGVMFPPMAAFGVVMLILIVWQTCSGLTKANQFTALRQAMELRRAALESQLHEMSASSRENRPNSFERA